MSKNTSIILGEHFTNFIKSEIQTGRYKSASEVVRNALRLLEIENKKVEAINRALVVGEKSGKPINFDNLKFKDQMRKKLKLNA